MVIPVEVAGAALSDELAHVEIPHLDDVRGNLTLPERTRTGARLVWTTSNSAVISSTGEVTRPEVGAPAARVTLTATLAGDAGRGISFDAVVTPLPVAEPYVGYLFVHFKGRFPADDERVYFALSDGNTALRWVELNGGAPVLTSVLGERGVRDPFIVRSPDGDSFYVVATDLNTSSTSWADAVRTGSRGFEVWESTDLVHWTEQRHVEVSPPDYGMTWAPEAYWDDTSGAFAVYWSSIIYPEGDRAAEAQPQIVLASTRDFVSISAPEPWLNVVGEPDFSAGVIDATMIRDRGRWYRFAKATYRGRADIVQQVSSSLRATQDSGAWSVQASAIATSTGTHEVEGPLIIRANDGDENGSGFYLFADEFGGRGYFPFWSPTLDDPRWERLPEVGLPRASRHGSLLAITQSERERLLAAFPPVVDRSE